MKKKYLCFSFLLLLFFTETLHSQNNNQSLTKKERRALKKQNKVISSKTANPVQPVNNSSLSVEQQMEIIVNQPVTSQTLPTTKTPPVVSLDEILKNSQELVIDQPNGAVNWTQQYIEATGQSVIDNERFKNPAQARLMAIRGAIVVAQRNLLEIVKGMHIVGETTVQDMMTTNDYIFSRVDGVVKGATQVGEAIQKNGFIEIKLRMPLYGQKSLANTLDENSFKQMRETNALETSKLLSQSETGEGVDGSKPVFFNIENGQALDPSLFPIILDDDGKVLFDFSRVYKLKDGKFPQYLQLGKEVLEALGNQKGVDVINMIQTGKGQFKIPEKSSKNVFWRTLGNIAQNVGSALFKLIF